MTLSRGSQWEATDRLGRSSSPWQEPVTQGLALNQLDPKMSMDSIAPTLVVKTPSLEPSDATPPAQHPRQPRRNAKGRVLRAASSLAPDMKSESQEDSQILGRSRFFQIFDTVEMAFNQFPYCLGEGNSILMQKTFSGRRCFSKAAFCFAWVI